MVGPTSATVGLVGVLSPERPPREEAPSEGRLRKPLRGPEIGPNLALAPERKTKPPQALARFRQPPTPGRKALLECLGGLAEHGDMDAPLKGIQSAAARAARLKSLAAPKSQRACLGLDTLC